MRKLLFLFALSFFQMSCSKNEEVQDSQVNEEKVLILDGGRVLYTGVLSGEIYTTQTTNHYNLGVFIKSEDAFFLTESAGTEIRVIPAEQYRSSPNLSIIEENIFSVQNLGPRRLGKVFFEETGFIHVTFSRNDELTFGVGKINTSTKQFEVVQEGFYNDPSAWINYHYDILDKKLYRFEDSFDLILARSVNIASGVEENLFQNFGEIDLGTSTPIFEASVDHNFYFTTRQGLNITLFKFNASTGQMTNMGGLPSTSDSVEDLYVVNSKNKVYYTSYSGSNSAICSYDFSSNVKTQIPIRGNQITGTINGTNQIIFID